MGAPERLPCGGSQALGAATGAAARGAGPRSAIAAADAASHPAGPFAQGGAPNDCLPAEIAPELHRLEPAQRLCRIGEDLRRDAGLGVLLDETAHVHLPDDRLR